MQEGKLAQRVLISGEARLLKLEVSNKGGSGRALEAATEIRPPHMPYRPTIPTLQQKLQTSLPLQNFVHLLRFLRARNEPMLGPPSSSKVAVRESTVMESNETPMVGSKSRFLHATEKSMAQDFCGNILKGVATTNTSTAARESEIDTFLRRQCQHQPRATSAASKATAEEEQPLSPLRAANVTVPSTLTNDSSKGCKKWLERLDGEDPRPKWERLDAEEPSPRWERIDAEKSLIPCGRGLMRRSLVPCERGLLQKSQVPNRRGLT
ncbi:Uncharacterized protein Fot_24379 [Forsythia ovata]|uniref:Uncharacterized protein n=1 Tax=Forsythia ovata TaxID=205694 RepID=A0ABD1U616_9LAMI